ncbi:subtilisin-like protein, partial [Delitschia confertaspora ATCC 74209]
IKVAILDTGIDATHPFVKKRWHRSDIMDRGYRDFVSNVVNTTPEDQDGHGTHVAGIILRFAPNAELYIARIAETNESCQKDKYINGKALKHALDSWEVDMVSMSFGLTNEDPEIKRQILRAYEKDVPLFAAACNDGSRKAVSYPANHILVYCINACDGDGKEAFFNPPARPNSLNFSILGMNVQSAWPAFEGGDPASKQKKGCFISQEKVLRGTTAKYMSGTSVATPFAVALVASVCAYERVNAALVSSEQKVKSHEGVKKLLKGMSRTVNGFDTIVPWDGRGSRFKDYKVIFADSLRFTLREQY